LNKNHETTPTKNNDNKKKNKNIKNSEQTEQEQQTVNNDHQMDFLCLQKGEFINYKVMA